VVEGDRFVSKRAHCIVRKDFLFAAIDPDDILLGTANLVATVKLDASSGDFDIGDHVAVARQAHVPDLHRIGEVHACCFHEKALRGEVRRQDRLGMNTPVICIVRFLCPANLRCPVILAVPMLSVDANAMAAAEKAEITSARDSGPLKAAESVAANDTPPVAIDTPEMVGAADPENATNPV
jgi:hypothetical protein